MLIVLDSALDQPALTELRALLQHVPFEDGRATAGWSAKLVKDNTQASADPSVEMWRDRLAATLIKSPMLQLAALPKRIIGPMFSRYIPGQSYGAHVDEPVMDGSRADISFTLFLSEPDDYDGGELLIDTPAGTETHKYAAGTLVLYPATTIHRVVPLTRGERLAAVGWVRSFIRDSAKRELLFDLGTVRHRHFELHGKTTEVDLLSKCHANLMRMWAED